MCTNPIAHIGIGMTLAGRKEPTRTPQAGSVRDCSNTSGVMGWCQGYWPAGFPKCSNISAVIGGAKAAEAVGLTSVPDVLDAGRTHPTSSRSGTGLSPNLTDVSEHVGSEGCWIGFGARGSGRLWDEGCRTGFGAGGSGRLWGRGMLDQTLSKGVRPGVGRRGENGPTPTRRSRRLCFGPDVRA